MELKFTVTDLMACMEESLTFRAIVAKMIYPYNEEAFASLAKEFYAKDGLIQAIKAVRDMALREGGVTHKLYSIGAAKKFVEKACNHKPYVFSPEKS
jgi:hypothetical protein